MDLLFSRYASPLDFMRLYINQGRFGEFVDGIVCLENKRRKEEQEKEEDAKLWQAYIHSMSRVSFSDWKDGLTQTSGKPSDFSMTDEKVEEVKGKARGILKRFSPA